jgi:Flp pilus assembly protein CpaB
VLTLARLRRRRRVPYWLTAGAVALVTAVVVARLAAGATAERNRWGAVRTAVVVTDRVAAGDDLAGHVTTRDLPVAMLPRGTLAALPRHALAAADLVPGELVLAHRLAGRSALAARLPRGTRGIAIPTADGLPVEAGDRVDLLATLDTGEAGSEPTVVVARDALVLSAEEDAVTVAVDEPAAARVAYALAAGTVTLVLSG